MILKTKVLICKSLVISFLLLATISCRKDNDNNKVTDKSNTVTDIDGNIYNTVKIGTQVWMVENLKTTRLNDGTNIPIVTDEMAWAALTTPASCTYKNTTNQDTINTYGRLYNWYAVNTGKLCPKGWHVPTDNDWKILENYLISNGYNYDGSTIGNKISKSMASVSLWNYSATEGAPGNNDYVSKKNSSGFTALPAGVRDAKQRKFGSIGNYAIWWSSSEYDSQTAWDRGVDYSLSSLGSLNVNKNYGFSVRCLKD